MTLHSKFLKPTDVACEPTASGMCAQAIDPELSSRNRTFGFTCTEVELDSGLSEMSVRPPTGVIGTGVIVIGPPVTWPSAGAQAKTPRNIARAIVVLLLGMSNGLMTFSLHQKMMLCT